MSVVAVRVYEDRIEIAADSIITRGDTKINTAGNSRPKLFKISGMLIGAVGDGEDISLLKHYFGDHMIENFDEEGILKFLISYKKWKKDIYPDEDSINQIIIACDGKCYSSDGISAFRIEDYFAIGAGIDQALGALHAGASPRDAVKAACDLCIYASEPILVESIPIQNGKSKKHNNDKNDRPSLGEEKEELVADFIDHMKNGPFIELKQPAVIEPLKDLIHWYVGDEFINIANIDFLFDVLTEVVYTKRSKVNKTSPVYKDIQNSIKWLEDAHYRYKEIYGLV